MNINLRIVLVLNILAFSSISYGQAESLGNQEMESLYAFITAQEASTICTGRKVRENVIFGGLFLALASGDAMTKQKLRSFMVSLPKRSRALKALGWTGAVISIVLIGGSLSVESENVGEWWTLLRNEFTLDKLLFDPYVNAAGANSDKIGAYLNVPGAYFNGFLRMTPEEAQPYLADSPQLQKLTIEYSHILASVGEVLSESGFMDQDGICIDIEERLQYLQTKQLEDLITLGQ